MQDTPRKLILRKIKEMQFYRHKVTFLGHDVDRDGLHINRDKVSSVNAWPTPKNTKEVQSFLGFAQYFR